MAEPSTTDSKLTPRQMALTDIGVGMPRRDQGRPKVKAPELKRSSVVWCDKPQYPGQFYAAEEVRQVRQTVHIFDLSDEKARLAYEALTNLEFNEDTNQLITSQERRYDERGSRWQVYVEVGTFQFKQILPRNIHGEPHEQPNQAGN